MLSDWLLYLATFVFVLIVFALAVLCGPTITILIVCGFTGIAFALWAMLRRKSRRRPKVGAARRVRLQTPFSSNRMHLDSLPAAVLKLSTSSETRICLARR